MTIRRSSEGDRLPALRAHQDVLLQFVARKHALRVVANASGRTLIATVAPERGVPARK